MQTTSVTRDQWLAGGFPPKFLQYLRDCGNGKNTRTGGVRGVSGFSFRKGLSLRAEIEKMNVYLPSFVSSTEGNRAWVWSAFVGFKKDYEFYKKIKGNVQVLYNIHDDHDNSPYINRLNVRMGFEFGMKKRKKL